MITPAVRLERALAIAKRYRIFPCKPDKKPLVKWKDEATQDEGKVREWWGKYPHALIAQVTGATSTHVVDIDAKGKSPQERAKALFNGHPMPPTFAYLTKSGGWHLHYESPEHLPITASVLAPFVDTRGDGGYVIRWDAEGCTVLCAEDPAPLPDWIAEKIREAPKAKSADADADGAPIPEGARNGTLASLAGTMRRRGMSPAAVEAALLVENAARCRPPLEEREVRQIAASVSRYAPDPGEDQSCVAEFVGAFGKDRDEPADSGKGHVKEFPDIDVADLIERAPRRIQNYVAWVLGNAERPVPQFALASALTFIGHVTARGYCGPTRVGPNLYHVLLGRTESGKDINGIRPFTRACADVDDWLGGRFEGERLVAYCVDRDHYAGARILEEFSSGQAIHTAMEGSPAITLAISELGHLLARTGGKGAPDHMAAIRTMLLNKFGADSSTIPRKRYADPRYPSRAIVHPSLAMIGGVNDAHCALIDLAAMQDGLLNRCVIIPASRPRFTPRRNKTEPPGDLIEWAASTTSAIYPGPPGIDGAEKRPIEEWRMIDFADAAASAFYDERTIAAADAVDDNPLHGRHSTKLIKVALVIALARDAGPKAAITKADLQWAEDYLSRCNAAAIVAVMRFGGLVSSQHHADLITLCEQLSDEGPVYASRLFKHRGRKEREEILCSAHAIDLVDFKMADKDVTVTGHLPRGVWVYPRTTAIAAFLRSAGCGAS